MMELNLLDDEINNVLAKYAAQLDDGSSGIGYHLDGLEGIGRDDITPSLIIECMEIVAKSTRWDRERHQLLFSIHLPEVLSSEILHIPDSIEAALIENRSCNEPPSLVMCSRVAYLEDRYSGIVLLADILKTKIKNFDLSKYIIQYSSRPGDCGQLAGIWTRHVACIYNP